MYGVLSVCLGPATAPTPIDISQKKPRAQRPGHHLNHGDTLGAMRLPAIAAREFPGSLIDSAARRVIRGPCADNIFPCLSLNYCAVGLAKTLLPIGFCILATLL